VSPNRPPLASPTPTVVEPLQLLGYFIEHPLRSPVVSLPFKQVQYFIHPLGGAIPVLPEILEGLHLASQRLRSRAQSPVQSAPTIRQGLAPAGGAAPGTRLTRLLFPAWHSEFSETPCSLEIVQGIGPLSYPRHFCCFVRSTHPRSPRPVRTPHRTP
jgi:hypothetical protein